MDANLEGDILDYIGEVLNKVEEIAEDNNKSKEDVLYLLLNELNAIHVIGW